MCTSCVLVNKVRSDTSTANCWLRSRLSTDRQIVSLRRYIGRSEKFGLYLSRLPGFHLLTDSKDTSFDLDVNMGDFLCTHIFPIASSVCQPAYPSAAPTAVAMLKSTNVNRESPYLGSHLQTFHYTLRHKWPRDTRHAATHVDVS